jgi:hypothetical protein
VRIGTTSPIEEVRTTLIELLCASAFDRLGVEPTYTETLASSLAVVLLSFVANRVTSTPRATSASVKRLVTCFQGP